MKLCSVNSCKKPKIKKRKLCATHLYRWNTYKSFELPKKRPEGTITYCGIHGYLTKEQTYLSGKSRHGKDRFRCKKCRYKSALDYRKKNREKYLSQTRCYDSTNPKRILSRFKERLKKFGLTFNQYEELYKKQYGKCAICKNDEKRLSVIKRKTKICIDHCHKTGKVRGLLCWKCNSMIGMADDSIPILRLAIDYLSSSRS